MIAMANPNGLPERNPGELDIEHSKQDIALIRSLANKGLLSPDSIKAIAERLEQVAVGGEKERTRVAADRALAAMQISLLKLLMETARGSGGDSGPVTNQQINIYLPQNGRESNGLGMTNGHQH